VRDVVDDALVRRFMRAAGTAAHDDGDCYFTGGATAVLLGWRRTTIDVDIELEPEQDSVLRALPRIKDDLRVNVELASPAHFVPVPDGWRERRIFVAREGRLTFRHYDPYSQALAKLERAHDRDLDDVDALIERGLVDRAELLAYFERIEPELYKFPAINPNGFRERVRAAVTRD
jgi:hypothetical protein